jgi:hypothetical protein
VNEVPKGPGFTLTFIYYFAGSSLIGLLLASQALHQPLSSGIPSQFALPIGLGGALAGVYFYGAKTLEIPMRGKKALLNRLDPILESMGYRLLEQSANTRTYQRDGLQGMFSGKVYAYFETQMAIVSSRAVHIRAIARRLEAGKKGQDNG